MWCFVASASDDATSAVGWDFEPKVSGTVRNLNPRGYGKITTALIRSVSERGVGKERRWDQR